MRHGISPHLAMNFVYFREGAKPRKRMRNRKGSRPVLANCGNKKTRENISNSLSSHRDHNFTRPGHVWKPGWWRRRRGKMCAGRSWTWSRLKESPSVEAFERNIFPFLHSCEAAPQSSPPEFWPMKSSKT